MAEIVNLRNVRKRANRDKAARLAAERRQAHGVSKSERTLSEKRGKRLSEALDQHRIETGDRR